MLMNDPTDVPVSGNEILLQIEFLIILTVLCVSGARLCVGNKFV